MLQMIEPSKSPYSAPVVIVRKKNGEHRFCIDYRKLNSVTKMDAEVMPYIRRPIHRNFIKEEQVLH